ncbi:MAG: hypothetical protein ACYDDS_21145 [Candidatus Sulfotelmatobacter sp.]
MSCKGRSISDVRTVALAAMLLACPCAMLAQRGAGGGHVGGGTAGGGGLSGGGRATGLDVKDDLKNFHAALAVQATSQQIIAYNLMVKSTAVASADLQALLEEAAGQNNAPELAGRDKAFGQALETARTQNKKFLDGLSDRQKSGLKELVKKLTKTDSDLAQQAKALDEQFEATKAPGPQIAGSAKSLDSTLTSFHNQQLDLGEEMSIGDPSNRQNTSFHFPPVKNSVQLADQTVAITTSGVISRSAPESNTFKLELSEDLSDLQQDITEILRGQLDKADACGEQISIQTAAFTPSEPASLVVVQLHFERWACFGKSTLNEMAEGNGMVEVRLTPAIADDGRLRIDAKLGRVNAEGLVGELLRSGSLGDTLRDKIGEAVLSSLRQASDYKTILPAAAQGSVTLHHAQFQGTGTGKLSMVLDGDIQLSSDAVTALMNGSKVSESKPGESKVSESKVGEPKAESSKAQSSAQ